MELKCDFIFCSSVCCANRDRSSKHVAHHERSPKYKEFIANFKTWLDLQISTRVSKEECRTVSDTCDIICVSLTGNFWFSSNEAREAVDNNGTLHLPFVAREKSQLPLFKKNIIQNTDTGWWFYNQQHSNVAGIKTVGVVPQLIWILTAFKESKAGMPTLRLYDPKLEHDVQQRIRYFQMIPTKAVQCWSSVLADPCKQGAATPIHNLLSLQSLPAKSWNTIDSYFLFLLCITALDVVESSPDITQTPLSNKLSDSVEWYLQRECALVRRNCPPHKALSFIKHCGYDFRLLNSTNEHIPGIVQTLAWKYHMDAASADLQNIIVVSDLDLIAPLVKCRHIIIKSGVALISIHNSPLLIDFAMLLYLRLMRKIITFPSIRQLFVLAFKKQKQKRGHSLGQHIFHTKLKDQKNITPEDFPELINTVGRITSQTLLGPQCISGYAGTGVSCHNTFSLFRLLDLESIPPCIWKRFVEPLEQLLFPGHVSKHTKLFNAEGRPSYPNKQKIQPMKYKQRLPFALKMGEAGLCPDDVVRFIFLYNTHARSQPISTKSFKTIQNTPRQASWELEIRSSVKNANQKRNMLSTAYNCVSESNFVCPFQNSCSSHAPANKHLQHRVQKCAAHMNLKSFDKERDIEDLDVTFLNRITPSAMLASVSYATCRDHESTSLFSKTFKKSWTSIALEQT